MIGGLLFVALAAPAGAQPQSSGAHPVVLAPIEYEGELVDAFRTRIEEQLREGFERAELELVDVGATLARPGGYRVITRLVVEERNYRLSLRVFDGGDAPIAEVERTCQLCGIQDVAEMVANEAAGIAGDLAARARALPLLRIDSRPSGAAIELDGHAIGSAPTALRVAVGRHRARAQLPGHFDQAVEIDAFAGMSQAITLQLVPRPVVTPEQRRRAAMGPVGVVAMVLGVGAAASGGVLLALDEQPLRSQCSGADVDAAGNCRQLYDTLGGGVALSVTGAISTAVGAALVGLAYGKRRPRGRKQAARSGGGHGRLADVR